MALIPSNMVPLGTFAPGFRLPDPAGRIYQLSDFSESPALLVAFWCNHCPYVQHIAEAFAEFSAAYQPKGLAVVAINANDAETHPSDAPEKMIEEITRRGYTFPYLIDEDQSIARLYDAACTPDFFLFDANKRLVYRGQFDDSRPGNAMPITGDDLRAATEAVLTNNQPDTNQIPSMGCNIKWRPDSLSL